jgi:hypothetical protein
VIAMLTLRLLYYELLQNAIMKSMNLVGIHSSNYLNCLYCCMVLAIASSMGKRSMLDAP